MALDASDMSDSFRRALGREVDESDTEDSDGVDNTPESEKDAAGGGLLVLAAIGAVVWHLRNEMQNGGR